MDVMRRDAMKAVRAHFRYLGLAGPTVAQAEQVIDALEKAGMLGLSTDRSQGAVEAMREAHRQLSRYGDKGPKQVGRALLTLERALGIDSPGGQYAEPHDPLARQSGPAPQSMEDGHRCFGCQKFIADHEPHIHVPMDEWGAQNGLEALGLDDIFTFIFCEACTEKTKRPGWTLEAHEITDREDGNAAA